MAAIFPSRIYGAFCIVNRYFGISHILMTSAVFELWGFSLFTAGWVGARVLVQVPLDRWRFSGNFGKLYVSMT